MKDRQQDLVERAIDYKRFSFIVLILSIFIFTGYFLPGEQQFSSVLLAGGFLGIFFSFIFNRKSVYYQKLLENQ